MMEKSEVLYDKVSVEVTASGKVVACVKIGAVTLLDPKGREFVADAVVDQY